MNTPGGMSAPEAKATIRRLTNPRSAVGHGHSRLAGEGNHGGHSRAGVEQSTHAVQEITQGASLLPPAPSSDELLRLLSTLQARFAAYDVGNDGDFAAVESFLPRKRLEGLNAEDPQQVDETTVCGGGDPASSPSSSVMVEREWRFVQTQLGASAPTGSRVASSFAAAKAHSPVGDMLHWFSVTLVRMFSDGLSAVADFPREWERRLAKEKKELSPYLYELQGFSVLFSFLWTRLALMDAFGSAVVAEVRERVPGSCGDDRAHPRLPRGDRMAESTDLLDPPSLLSDPFLGAGDDNDEEGEGESTRDRSERSISPPPSRVTQQQSTPTKQQHHAAGLQTRTRPKATVTFDASTFCHEAAQASGCEAGATRDSGTNVAAGTLPTGAAPSPPRPVKRQHSSSPPPEDTTEAVARDPHSASVDILVNTEFPKKGSDDDNDEDEDAGEVVSLPAIPRKSCNERAPTTVAAAAAAAGEHSGGGGAGGRQTVGASESGRRRPRPTSTIDDGEWCIRGEAAGGAHALTAPHGQSLPPPPSSSSLSSSLSLSARRTRLAAHSHALSDNAKLLGLLAPSRERLPLDGLVPNCQIIVKGVSSSSSSPSLNEAMSAGTQRVEGGKGHSYPGVSPTPGAADPLLDAPIPKPVPPPRERPVLKTIDDAARAVRAEELCRQLGVRSVTDYAHERDRRDYLASLEAAEQQLKDTSLSCSLSSPPLTPPNDDGEGARDGEES